jgi:hypothetical protein
MVDKNGVLFIKEKPMFKTIVKNLKEKVDLATPGTKEAAAEVSKGMIETGVSSMGGLAPVAVVLLRNHTVDAVFTILATSMPGGLLLAGAGKMLFRNTIEMFTKTMHEKGEPYLMNAIAEIWRDKTVALDDLRGGIDKIPDIAVKADIKREALQLVDKYHSGRK